MQTILWTKCLRYECNGPANKVLNQCTIPLDPSKWTSNSVLVRWLASPINPLDLNIIEGRYALIKPKLPAIGGTEAIGIVERVGLDVRNLKCGQRVIRFRMPLSSDSDASSNGVWTELGIYPSDVLLSINPKIDLISAATLAINPPTALALLREFFQLKRGDWIIQNAANSGVGRAVIQLAKVYGYKTLNLIRNRPNVDELKAELHSLGADLVMTEEEFGIKLREINPIENALPKPLLALNGTGGRSALLIASALDRNGILVTYGGMSKRPVEIGTGAFIFNGICAKGFSLGTWIMENDVEKVTKMFAELQELILNGKLRPPPAKIVPMQKYTEAIENAISHGTKQILLLSDNEELRRNNKI